MRNPKIAKPDGQCPDDMRLAAYVDGSLNTRERHGLELHLAECEFCLEQVAALAHLEAADLPEAPPMMPGLLARARALPPKQVRSSPTTWRWITASLATAAAAAVLVVWIAPPRNAPPDSIRAGSSYTAQPLLLLPHEGEALRRTALEFHWTAVQNALYYEPRLLNGDGDLLWQERVDKPVWRAPDSLQLHSGQKYFVFVSAFLPDGKAVKSPAVSFQVTDR